MRSIAFVCIVAALSVCDVEALRKRKQAAIGNSSQSNAAGFNVVVSRLATDDTQWLTELGVSYTLSTEVDRDKNQTGAKPLTRDGRSTRECGGYLSYIVENYDKLPAAMAFVQGQPLKKPSDDGEDGDWHTDPQAISLIADMAADPSKVGYCSLNNVYFDWSTDPWDIYAWRKQLNSSNYALLQRTVLPLLPESGFQCYCCAQFAVSRERVQAHPRAVYEQLLTFIEEDPAEKITNANSRCAMMERYWHVLFGEETTCGEDALCDSTYGGVGDVRHMMDDPAAAVGNEIDDSSGVIDLTSGNSQGGRDNGEWTGPTDAFNDNAKESTW